MKRGICLVIALCILFTLSLNTQPALSQSESGEVTRDTPFVPGQVIVGFDDSVAAKAVPAQAAALAGEVQAAVLKVSGSTALLEFAPDADVEGLAAQLQDMDTVDFAEPNALFWLPELAPMEYAPNLEYILRDVQAEKEVLVPISTLQSMKKRVGGKIQAVYPNDKGLWWNTGWREVGADIVSPNTTPSKNVCVIDTGVDHTNPDLIERIILGKDFVNNDNGPMDDHGHGTHVAGVIVAKKNNKFGIAGVSPGKVVAVKALSAQGPGTSFDIAEAIYYCANRSDVSVINMSLGGSYRSQMGANAVAYAVNIKNKLIVAAAGNNDSSSLFYPAAFSLEFPNQVLSVAASGLYIEDDYDYYFDNRCKASYSNHGTWVDIIGPGTDIYSTLPWKKPFTLNGRQDTDGLGYLSGTSMAAPFVSAVAARAWGYQPGFTNSQVSLYIKQTGNSINTACWPSSMSGVKKVNVARALQRGAAQFVAYDAVTGLPLSGANVTAYQNGTSRGSAIITPSIYNYSGTTYTYYTAYTDIVNLPTSIVAEDFDDIDDVPASMIYSAKVSKSGYTASPQASFINGFSDSGKLVAFVGGWVYAGETFVPPRSTNFTAVNHDWNYWNNSDLVTFLPNLPKPVSDGQPSKFIVSMMNGWDFGHFEGESIGSLSVFPYARHMAEGSGTAYGWDSAIVRTKPGNSAVPYYTGDYVFAVWNADSSNPTSFFIWKDGVIKKRVNLDCSGTWWRPLTLSQKSGKAVYTVDNYCGGTDILPYY